MDLHCNRSYFKLILAETENAKINFKLFGLLHSLVMTSLPKLEANELRNVSEIIEDILNSQLAVEDSQESFWPREMLIKHFGSGRV